MITKPNLTLTKAAALTFATAAIIAGGAGAAVASASVSPSTSGTEHFQIMRTSASAKKSSVIATGAFAGGGTISNGFGNGGTGNVTLPGGKFKITAKKVSVAAGFNTRTCVSTTDGNGAYKLHGGTGKYAKISGSGKFTIKGLTVDARNSKGKCTAKPVAYQLIITLHGPAKP
jgi:hypothetical protein